MYEAFYQLSVDPFRLSPDHRFCFAHGSYAKARAYLQYGLQRAEGLVAVTGSPGTGKSTLVEDLLAGLTSSRTVFARLVSTQLKATDLLRMLAFEFKIRAEGMGKATMLRNVEAFLVIQAGAGRRVLVIVDEAQDLSADALEELRLLTNMQLKGKPLVQVFLLGQEQLHAKMMSPAMEQLRQRLVAVSRLKPMTAEETHAYIAHRLERAGWNGDPEIAGEAIELVYRHSNGVPRLVNQTCSRLLLYGAAEQKHKLYGADVQVVIKEFEDEMPASPSVNAPQTTERQRPTSREAPPKAEVLPSKSPASLEKVLVPGDPTQRAIRLGSIGAKADAAAEAGSRAHHQDRDAQAAAQLENVKSPDSQSSAAKSQTKPKRGKIAASILVTGLIGVGALAVASLESQPFGSTLANWSRNVASEMRGVLASGRTFATGDDPVTGPALPVEDTAKPSAGSISNRDAAGRDMPLDALPASRIKRVSPPAVDD
ncbi:MAG: ExeA family protein [Gammaproteobacteria bacterium]